MLRGMRKEEKDRFGSAAGNLAAARAGSATRVQAGEGAVRPLLALAPEVTSPSVKLPFARDPSSVTLACKSPVVRLEPSLRRLLTNRRSERVQDKVPIANVCARVAQLNR